jgi:hypothetical protein
MPEARLDSVARTPLAYLSTDIPDHGKPAAIGRRCIHGRCDCCNGRYIKQVNCRSALEYTSTLVSRVCFEEDLFVFFHSLGRTTVEIVRVVIHFVYRHQKICYCWPRTGSVKWMFSDG